MRFGNLTLSVIIIIKKKNLTDFSVLCCISHVALTFLNLPSITFSTIMHYNILFTFHFKLHFLWRIKWTSKNKNKKEQLYVCKFARFILSESCWINLIVNLIWECCFSLFLSFLLKHQFQRKYEKKKNILIYSCCPLFLFTILIRIVTHVDISSLFI